MFFAWLDKNWKSGCYDTAPMRAAVCSAEKALTPPEDTFSSLKVRCSDFGGTLHRRTGGQRSGFAFLLRLGIGNELIPQAAHREQMPRFGRVSLNVAAQAHDKIVDRARIRVFVKIPDVLQDGFA